ncbi:MAG: hypothetical protein H0W15_02490 [Gemmatimonadales bacterium]|nr:hypothetical protein [Gemmatimonadales bacterium]
MTMFRKAAIMAGLGLGALTLSAAPAAAQSATAAAPIAPAPAQETTPPAGPRLAPRWEPAPVLLPGQSEEREINAAARANSVTIPVVTLLLGIIILILLVG